MVRVWTDYPKANKWMGAAEVFADLVIKEARDMSDWSAVVNLYRYILLETQGEFVQMSTAKELYKQLSKLEENERE